jgi:hypothetical protein
MTQFYVRDQESISVNPNTFYKVLLYSHTGKCDNFFGIPAQEIASKPDQIKEKLELLTRHNVWVEGVVEKSVEGHLFMRDTALRY